MHDEISAGTVIGERFEVEALAGEGGMGRVYRARDRTDGSPVALKFLSVDGKTERERFAREAQMLSRLAHRSVVRYVANGATDDGALYLAMEWLDGEDLAQRIERGPLSVADALALVAQIADALATAHTNGVVHRDVKPANVFLVGGGVARAKLLDFGIARATLRATAATGTGVLVGTPAYMSPEQARGDRSLGARSDVFSLGCVLFECVTGRVAFEGDHAVAVLAKVLFEDPPRASTIRAEVSPGLDALIARMLAKDPARRFADGAEVGAALAHLDDAPTGGFSAGRPSLLTHHEQRRLFVVMTGPAPRRTDSTATDATAFATTLASEPAHKSAFQTIAAASKARIERLLDGTIVAALDAPGSAVDGAARAARCALALRSEMADVPIALATGRGVLDGAFPVGDVIDRVVEILRSGPPPRPAADATLPVRIDETTAGLLGLRFEVAGDDRGLHLVGEREAPASTRTLLGRPSPCVGRDRELATLVGTFSESVNEPVARAMLVTAPPGFGKSRLRHEFLAQIARGGTRTEVFTADGDPIRAGSAFGMLGQLVRRAASIQDGEPIEAQRRKLRARVTRHVAEGDAARVVEFLGELCGVEFPDDQSVSLRSARHDPQLMGTQMLRAWEEWLRAECRVGPVLLVVDDLHWGDVPSVKYLDWALRKLHDEPLMVLALARPEVHTNFPSLWSDRALQEIRLGELSRKAGEKLARQMLGDLARPEIVARILNLFVGNAFYLEELIRAVAEGHGDTLPESVLAMVQVRFEALEPDARRVLRAASVFGGVFWRAGVLRLLGPAATHAHYARWLDTLAERELIEQRPDSRVRGESEYGFRHALVREAAYAALTDADRALGHAVAGAWLEEAGEQDAMTLAEHFDRGGVPDAAARWYTRAAAQALEGGDFTAALERARRGTSFGPTDADRTALRSIELEALRWSGRVEDLRQRAREIMASEPEGTNAWCDAIAEAACFGEPLEPLEKALREYEPTAESRRAYVVAVARVLTQSAISLRHRETTPLHEKLLAELACVGCEDPALLGWAAQAESFRAAAEFDLGEARRLLAHARECFERVGDVRNAYAQWADESFPLIEIGRYEEAEEVSRAVIAHSETTGLQRLVRVARVTLLLALSGRGADADAIAEGAIVREQWPLGSRLGTFTLCLLSSIKLRMGDLDGAERDARDAFDFVRTTPSAIHDARGTLARVLVARGHANEALEILRGDPPVEHAVFSAAEFAAPRHFLALAEARTAIGDTEGARAAVRAGLAAVRASAERIRDPAVRASYIERVRDHIELRACASRLGVET